jgi:predicted permease
MGAALGLVVAYAGVGMLSAFAARFSPRANEIAVDGMVLGFTFLLALLVAVALSFVPSLGDESALGAGLSAGTTRTTGDSRRRRLQQALVVTQVAVSLVLLTGAGLLVRSMQRLAEVDPGLDPENVLTMEVPVDFTQLAELQAAVSQYERMQTELSTLPGVQVVGVGSTMPLRTAQFQLQIKAEGQVIPPGQPVPSSEYRTADAGYFRAAGIPIIAGRDFTAGDGVGAPLVVVLNKMLADRLFPGLDPIGRRITWTGDVLQFIGMKEEWRTVVGVVGNTKDGGLDAEPLPVTFTPFAQGAFPTGGLVIRSDVASAGIERAARSIVRSIAPTQPIENVMTVNAIRDESIGPRRLNALLVGSFGLLALVVAAIGIAAVLAFSVASRQNEIGIRMSLGANSGQVQRMVLREGGILLGAGVVAGLLGAVATTRLMRGLLFGVAPTDPLTMVGVAALMASVGIAACWLPARRAARIDPAVAMRGK